MIRTHKKNSIPRKCQFKRKVLHAELVNKRMMILLHIKENNMESLQKLQTEVPYNTITPLLGTNYLLYMKSLYQRGICPPMFIATLLRIFKIWIQTRAPLMEGYIKKKKVLANHGILFSYKKKLE